MRKISMTRYKRFSESGSDQVTNAVDSQTFPVIKVFLVDSTTHCIFVVKSLLMRDLVEICYANGIFQETPSQTIWLLF